MLLLSLVATAWSAPPTEYYDLGFILSGTDAFAAGVGAPSVEYDGGEGVFVMYFESPAPAADTPAGCANSYRIGRATSEDGVNWAVEAAPVYSPDPSGGSPRGCSVAQPAVLHDGTQWNLFYSASKAPNEGETSNAPSGIGWATSTDGLTWHPQSETLVPFTAASVGLASASALNGMIYLAYSEDPDIWMISRPVAGGSWSAPERIVDHTTLGSWASDWTLGPSLLCNERAENPLGMTIGGDTTGGVRSLGWVNSANSHTWALDEGSPYSAGSLDYSTLNHWESLRAGDGHLLWYSKTDPATAKKAIGVAVSDTRLGVIFPRVCPSPWLPEVPDTGDTGGGDTADTGDTADSGAGDSAGDTGAPSVDCDCAADDGGCGCATPGRGGPAALAALAGLGALFGRRRHDNA